MIYVQLQNRAKVEMGQPLHLGAAARIIGPKGAQDIRLPCPDQQGVWKLEAILVTRALQQKYPQEAITLLGADICYVHRGRRPTATR